MDVASLLAKALRIGGLLLAGWLAYGSLMYWLQDAMLFPIPGGIGVDQLDQAAHEQGAETFHVRAADGTSLYGWHRRVHTTGEPRVVLYLHGNGETVAGNVPLQRLLQNDGWDFLTIAYRGYPGSDGKPSEAGLLLDAKALWDHALALDYAPDRIVLHGRSLGGGVAIALASQSNPAGMVLESTFYSLLELAEDRAPFLPVSWLLRTPMESYRLAPRVGVPVLELHSRDDGLIPVEHGRRLSQRFAEVEYIETEGYTHNDVLPAASAPLRKAYVAFLERVVPR